MREREKKIKRYSTVSDRFFLHIKFSIVHWATTHSLAASKSWKSELRAASSSCCCSFSPQKESVGGSSLAGRCLALSRTLGFSFLCPKRPIRFLFPGFVVLHREFLLLHGFQLVPEVELGRLFLELGKLVLVLRHLLQRWLNEFSSEVIHGDVELIDPVIFKFHFFFHIILLVLQRDDFLVICFAYFVKAGLRG